MKIEIKKTSNYDQFALNEINRPMHDLRALMASMAMHGFIPGCAIHVVRAKGGKLKIVAGHHRFAAAKQLGIPLWYIVDDVEISPIELEAIPGSGWTGNDIVGAKVQAGDPDYIALSTFMRDHKMNLAPASALVGGDSAHNTYKHKSAKAGTFKAGDMTLANKVARITDALLAKGVDFAVTTPFVGALSQIIMLPEVSVEAMAERVEKYSYVLRKRATRVDYLEEIENFYNYNARNKIPLKFLVASASKGRHGSGECRQLSLKKSA